MLCLQWVKSNIKIENGGKKGENGGKSWPDYAPRCRDSQITEPLPPKHSTDPLLSIIYHERSAYRFIFTMPAAILTYVSPLIYGTELRIRDDVFSHETDDVFSHETLVIVKRRPPNAPGW
jgi:hypothetical protein